MVEPGASFVLLAVAWCVLFLRRESEAWELCSDRYLVAPLAYVPRAEGLMKRPAIGFCLVL